MRSHFSAGANLMLLLLEAQEEQLGRHRPDGARVPGRDDGAEATRTCRSSSRRRASCSAAAARSSLHGDRVQAAAESYIGLVEVGVGLIPAGGGTKEMLARATSRCRARARDLLALTQRVFETIGFAKVSTSGARRAPARLPARRRWNHDEPRTPDGRRQGAWRWRARRTTSGRSRSHAIPVGGDGVQAALKLGVHLAWRAGRISDHDALIGRDLANILAGGDRPGAGTASEQQLLDLEREAFLSLCGQRKTQERIAHTLKTGKTLRN